MQQFLVAESKWLEYKLHLKKYIFLKENKISTSDHDQSLDMNLFVNFCSKWQ